MEPMNGWSSAGRPSRERGGDIAPVGKPTRRRSPVAGRPVRSAAGTLTRTVPTAVIAFDFDPLLHLGDGAVRWETIGVAVAIFAALVLAGITARSLGLRLDDLLFVVLGIVPGAVIGGRLGYVFLHADWFGLDPTRILDPSIGSLELTLAVVGGATTGAIVAGLLDGQPGRWLHAATLPILVALAGGKLATVLGGSGQGQPWGGDWSTAYLGPGPWGSLGPEVPSHPSQVYEALATIAVLIVLMGLLTIPVFRRPDGRAFLVALAAWAVARFIVAGTWRDPIASGPFRLEQILDLAVAGGAIALLGLLLVRRRRSGVRGTTDRDDELEEPFDATRTDAQRAEPG
jgi:prolipoprotein diacylglyceryltransferase